VNDRILARRTAGVAALGCLALASLQLAPHVVRAAEPAATPAAPAAASDTAQLSPQQLMESVSKRMFAALDADRAELNKSPEKVFPIIDQILLPNFDTEYAAQQVLAQYWRTATPEQRSRFVKALYRALLHTYGGALADFTADRLKLLPFRGDISGGKATVHTEVTRSNGDVVKVDYRLHKTDQGWKAFDVVIEGISYVMNYRNDLGAEAGAKGLEAVITRLERDGLALDKPKAGGH
jgi:phospholipid transport system substrate-binding protein